MSINEALKLVKRFSLVEPGKFALMEINRTPHYRYFVINRLRTIHHDGIHLCAWCNKQQVEPKLFKFCSNLCRDSVDLINDSKNPALKAYILIERQNCACAYCGISYEDEIVRRIEAAHKINSMYEKNGHRSSSLVDYFQIGHRSGFIWHMDHKIPISKGGHGILLSNLQVVCTKCHHKKTKEERYMNVKHK